MCDERQEPNRKEADRLEERWTFVDNQSFVLLPFLISFQGHTLLLPLHPQLSTMPAAAERPRPQILPIREGPRRQSPPPYNKSPGTRSPPPPSLSSSTPKAVLSPRTKKSLPSPPLEPEVNQFDKLGAKPRSPSPLKPEPELEHKSESRTEPPHFQALERAEEPKQAQDREEKEASGTR